MAGKSGGVELGGGNSRLGFEDAEFPILCESCLGDNPYVRMQKENHAGTCKMCDRAFTIFRWKPNRKSSYKKTEVCQSCAKIKNQCQTCILDLKYGLPSQLRDTIMDSKPGTIAMPLSDGQQHYQQIQSINSINQGAYNNPSEGLIDHVRDQVANPTTNKKIKQAMKGTNNHHNNNRDASSSNGGTKRRYEEGPAMPPMPPMPPIPPMPMGIPIGMTIGMPVAVPYNQGMPLSMPISTPLSPGVTDTITPTTLPLPPKPSGAPPLWAYKKKNIKKKIKKKTATEIKTEEASKNKESNGIISTEAE